jgi:hypothetical protein
MPTMSVLVGGVAGALITFVLTSCRLWWRRRRLARDAAQRLAPQLEALNAALTDALAAHSWQSLDRLELSNHSLPGLTMTIVKSLPQRTLDSFVDGVLAVHELDRARDSMSLAAPHERDRLESYRRRIDAAGAIATTLADNTGRRAARTHS